jgi:thioredoxin reductase (NADPH)
MQSELRVADLQEAPPAQDVQADVSQAPPAEAPKKPLIVVIDDDADFLNVLVRELRKLNEADKFDLLQAPSGEQGIAIARPYLVSKQPVFVMTDYRMPGLTGTQVVQTVRRDHPEAFVRFLVYSGYDTPDSALPLKELSPSEFMTKPMDLRDLRSDLRRLVGSWLARIETPSAAPAPALPQAF